MRRTNLRTALKLKKIAFAITIFLLAACTDKSYTPKPIAYPRIHFPEKDNYLIYQNEHCPFSFEYVDYAEIIYKGIDKIKNPCWFNVYFKDFNATLYMSYSAIGDEISLEKVLEDAHKLKNAHNKKADYIDEAKIKNSYGVKGELSEIGGNVATNVQFYLSDFEKHYVRGSLYFRATPNIDSVQPMVDFIKADMLHVFETFKWTE